MVKSHLLDRPQRQTQEIIQFQDIVTGERFKISEVLWVEYITGIHFYQSLEYKSKDIPV